MEHLERNERGVNFGDRAKIFPLVQAMVDSLGSDWIAQLARKADRSAVMSRGGSEAAALLPLMAAADYLTDANPEWRQAHRELGLQMGMLAQTLATCSKASGASNLFARLRLHLHAGRHDQYLDTLFEAEAGAYWALELADGRVEFPDAPNPDFWAFKRLGEYDLRVPNECKRVSPIPKSATAQESVQHAVERFLRSSYDVGTAVKIIVWLHVPADQLSNEVIIDAVRSVLDVAVAPAKWAHWISTCDPKGRFQVSAAAAPEFAMFETRPIHVLLCTPIRRSTLGRVGSLLKGGSSDGRASTGVGRTADVYAAVQAGAVSAD